jgi:uncharacterized repeat protein (TIGR04138 family)
MRQEKLEQIAERDGRYAYEAYEFLYEALDHTLHMLGKVPPLLREPDERYHVTGEQLLNGVRDLALKQFGLMARTVFHAWGINRTGDFGEIVFTLVEAGLMSKTEEDSLHDFQDVYDLDDALVKNYRIELDEGADS